MSDPTDDEDGYQGPIVLEWHGDHPDGLDDRVIEDIRISLWGLSKPEDLFFHSVFLGETMEGPSVTVWGQEGSPKFHCNYSAETCWTDGKETTDV